MKTYLIKDRIGLADWFAKINLMGDDFYPITLQVFKGDKKHRSLMQNDLSHVWYREIAKQSQHMTLDEVKRECKLTCGVPILRAENAEFNTMWCNVVKGHDYEARILMMEFLPVTSLMSAQQMSDYLIAMYYKYTGAGYYLEWPDEGEA